MLLGLPTTVRFFAGQGGGGGFQNGGGPKTNLKMKSTNQHSKELLFRYKHELNYKVLGGLRHWALGLGGELREVTELIWGPPNEASPPPPLTMGPIPHDGPKWR